MLKARIWSVETFQSGGRSICDTLLCVCGIKKTGVVWLLRVPTAAVLRLVVPAASPRAPPAASPMVLGGSVGTWNSHPARGGGEKGSGLQ